MVPLPEPFPLPGQPTTPVASPTIPCPCGVCPPDPSQACSYTGTDKAVFTAYVANAYCGDLISARGPRPPDRWPAARPELRPALLPYGNLRGRPVPDPPLLRRPGAPASAELLHRYHPSPKSTCDRFHPGTRRILTAGRERSRRRLSRPSPLRAEIRSRRARPMSTPAPT